jgi:hypothetical protein
VALVDHRVRQVSAFIDFSLFVDAISASGTQETASLAAGWSAY